MFNKTKLACALSAAIVGSALTIPAQAVNLTHHGLGDAVLGQYYTAKDDWQTFIRLINTSDDQAVAVKVRFREAANSREVLDFTIFLSPNDVWSGWTDKAAARNADGDFVPGIRTNDTSCIYPEDGDSHLGEGFELIKAGVDGAADVIGAPFKDRAYVGDYDDNSSMDVTARLTEGHFEVVGVAAYDDSSEIYDDILHNSSTDKPENCSNAIENFVESDPDDYPLDVENVIAANAYLINVEAGQGAGYDPTILANFTNVELTAEANSSQTLPDLDSARPMARIETPDGWTRTAWFGSRAFNQTLGNGDDGTSTTVPATYAADINLTGTAVSTGVGVDLNGDGVCVAAGETLDEAALTPAQHNAIFNADGSAKVKIGGPLGGCYRLANIDGTVGWVPLSFGAATYRPTYRQAQYGQAGASDVSGGIDAVSSLLMRTSVINEWAARPKPDGTITDYYTQWVITKPTKNYYVDLETDPVSGDDVSPMLVDPSTGNDAYAPFTQEFDIAGESCESFHVGIWNVEENDKYWTSPGPSEAPELCYETNVLTFHEDYETRGLNSAFASSIPSGLLPTDYDGEVSKRGWAEITFTGQGAGIGLTGYASAQAATPTVEVKGLPVHGFMLSVFNTNDSMNNHTTIHDHKYGTDVTTLDTDG